MVRKIFIFGKEISLKTLLYLVVIVGSVALVTVYIYYIYVYIPPLYTG